MHTATQGETNTTGLEHPALFDELIAPHVQKVFRVAYRITRNREDAEDAKQDAFLQAFTHFGDFDGRSKFATWLTRIAINSALMILRKRKTDRIVSLDGESNFGESKAFQEPTDSTPDAEQQYLQKEREATLRDAISRLRPSLRGVLEVAHIGERSVRESADIIGVSPATTKARLFHARAALRKSLCRFRNDRPSHNRSSIQGLSWNFQQSKEGANHVQTT